MGSTHAHPAGGRSNRAEATREEDRRDASITIASAILCPAGRIRCSHDGAPTLTQGTPWSATIIAEINEFMHNKCAKRRG